MAQESSQTQEYALAEESATTLLILLMRLPSHKLSQILFASNQRALDEVSKAFALVPPEFIEESKT